MYNFTSLQSIEQHPIVKKFVTITASVFIVFILMLFLPWQQTARGIGKVIALDPIERDYRISATVDGFLEKIYVKENQFVKKGTKLFKMIDLDAQYQKSLFSIKNESIRKYDNQAVKLTNLEENLESLYVIIVTTLEIYDKKIKQVKNALETLLELKIALANQKEIDFINYTRINTLYKDGLESKRNLELRYTQYLQTNAKFKKIIYDIENSENELLITKQNRENFKSENDVKVNSYKNNILLTKNILNTFKQDIDRNTINLSRYKNREVLAKTDGYVVRIYLNDQNRLIKRGEDILYFAPTVTQRAIRLRVSDFHMPLVKKGLGSRIIFYGWPALQISGWPIIQHGTYAGIITTIERTSYEKGAYYAIITEDTNEIEWPTSEYLKVGTQATLWVRLETVSLGYEMWRRLLGQPPKMAYPVKLTKDI